MPKKNEKKGLSLRDFEQETKKLESPKTDKERQITEAAIALIAERGIDGATTAEIARRADVTERTLFRYFPSKKVLVRRVMLPLLHRLGYAQQWEELGRILKSQGGDFEAWFAAASKSRLVAISSNPGLARTALLEILNDDEFRGAIAPLWSENIFMPMIGHIESLKRSGALRKDVDAKVLARAMQSLHVGYFLTRFFLAPGQDWNDASEIDQMAALLARGATVQKRRS